MTLSHGTRQSHNAAMKIRIHNDSVRLRLSRDEVDQIGRGDAVDCETRFPDSMIFSYSLTVSAVDQVQSRFDGQRIEVTLPAHIARQWATNESKVSVHGEQTLPGGTLKLLVEKDFECLEPRSGEDQSNRFPNPAKASNH